MLKYLLNPLFLLCLYFVLIMGNKITTRIAEDDTSSEVPFAISVQETIQVPVLRAVDCHKDSKIRIMKKNKRISCFKVIKGGHLPNEYDDISKYKL